MQISTRENYGVIDQGSDNAECCQITLEFDVTLERFEIVATNDGHEFDPLAQSAPDLEDAEMSGMAIELIRNLTEDASYRRSNDKNILALAFRLAGPLAAAARLPARSAFQAMTGGLDWSG